MPARKQSIGLVTGPRPGLAICSFTEGIVETVLRCLVATGCVCAVGVWCSVAVLTANYPATSSSIASGDNATLPLIVYKSTTLGLTAGGVGITWEVAVIVLRFLNIGILNMMSRVFLSTDIIAHAITGALFTASLVLSSLSLTTLYSVTVATGVLGSVLAAVVLSGLMILLIAVTTVWLLLFLRYNWTTHIITYTVKAELLL